MKKKLILGYGYVAKYLKDYLKSIEPDGPVFTTSRQSGDHIKFDLLSPLSWSNLPVVDETYWTFPAEPTDWVEKFLKEKSKELGKIVIIGSTKGFEVETDRSVISEQSPRNMEIERVLSENIIREQGGVIVCASGIYGPKKNPKDWLLKGYVTPSERLVNLIHVDDLVEILYKAMTVGKNGSIYIASDAWPRTWNEINQYLQSQESFALPENSIQKKKLSKIINSSWTLNELGVDLKYPSFIDSVF